MYTRPQTTCLLTESSCVLKQGFRGKELTTHLNARNTRIYQEYCHYLSLASVIGLLPGNATIS